MEEGLVGMAVAGETSWQRGLSPGPASPGQAIASKWMHLFLPWNSYLLSKHLWGGEPKTWAAPESCLLPTSTPRLGALPLAKFFSWLSCFLAVILNAILFQLALTDLGIPVRLKA